MFRAVLGRRFLNDPVSHEPVKPLTQYIGWGVFGRDGHVLETRSPKCKITNDEQAPFIAEDIEATRDWARGPPLTG